jgi:hypothetical protein
MVLFSKGFSNGFRMIVGNDGWVRNDLLEITGNDCWVIVGVIVVGNDCCD